MEKTLTKKLKNVTLKIDMLPHTTKTTRKINKKYGCEMINRD